VFEDLDRIEVIRGPGPTLWGANAMNSVINVITRSARDTQGWYAMAGAGTYTRRMATVRYGGQLAENQWFRVHAKYTDHDGLVDAEGRSTGDEWGMLRGGFRMDALLGEDLHFTLQSDAYGSLEMGEVVNVPVAPGRIEQRAAQRRVRGGNVLGRIGRRDADSGEGWSFQAYYDGGFRRQAAGFDTSHVRDLLDDAYLHDCTARKARRGPTMPAHRLLRKSATPQRCRPLRPARRSLAAARCRNPSAIPAGRGASAGLRS
jgi:iron complex outermembrane recepter protein